MNEQKIRATAIKIVIDWLCRNGMSESWDVIVATADKTADYIKGEQK